MESPAILSEAKDEVLRRIGRNVLLFQQVEQQLKFLLEKGSFSGTLRELEGLVSGGTKRFDRRTMGQLIEPLIETHLTPADASSVASSNTPEPHVSFTLTIRQTPEELAEFKRQLGDLVAERNMLIHHSLSHYRFDSIDGCVAASADLEQQRSRIAPVREKLAEMIKLMVEASVEFAKELKKRRESELDMPPQE